MEEGSRVFDAVIVTRSHEKPRFGASPSQYKRALAPHAAPPVKLFSAMAFGMAPPGVEAGAALGAIPKQALCVRWWWMAGCVHRAD